MRTCVGWVASQACRSKTGPGWLLGLEWICKYVGEDVVAVLAECTDRILEVSVLRRGPDV